MKKLQKNYIFIFIIFLMINIFFIWIISNIITIQSEFKLQNTLLSKNAKHFMINGGIEIDNKYLLELFSEEEIIIEKDMLVEEDKIIKCIFYNYDIEKSFELSSGRMFKKDELIESKKVAIVGYDFKDSIINGKISINNESYNVVGVLEDYDIFNKTIYLNMKSLKENLTMEAMKIDVKGKQNIYEEVSSKLKEDFNIEVYMGAVESIINPLKVAIGENSIHIILGILTSISLVSLIINIGTYWIDKTKKLIGIESLVGGTKISIAIKLWREYVITVIISLGITAIVWSLIHILRGVESNITLGVYGVLLIVNIFISTVAIVIPIIKLLRLDINTIIKENT
ncbi:ABC transporter permease [uncultured Clostridium sp.]|uniref:ABC transporter permease n=1 Tax=uncultured Clostridium sp. TaxID=59620 RepID=UPI0026065804|nr:ABC transporter permease [uncultured Clostridium sp.]